MKYYSATDSGKLQIARRGDHWSPLFKLFKLFSYINQQPKQTAKQALFGKESCQRQLTERLKNILFIYDIQLQIRLLYQGQSLRFSCENHLPLHVMPYGYKGGKAADFWACYLLPKFNINRSFMCKPAVCIGVQRTPLRC